MKRAIFISAVLLELFASHVCAQITWKEIPFEKPISTFMLEPDGSIFIVADSTLYLSKDSGTDWFKISDGVAGVIGCDSSGAFFKKTSVSQDSGRSWSPFGNTFNLSIAATQNGIYVADEYGHLLFTTNYGRTWDTLEIDAESDDWRGIYCGSQNRMIACRNLCSCFQLFAMNSLLDDTPAIGNLSKMDNDAPCCALFGKDKYIYAYDQTGMIRLAPNSHRWEIYDSVQNPHVRYFPIASPNALSLIDIDSTGTYLSYDHGTSWSLAGKGLPYPYVVFTNNGTGYALANDTLYTTASVTFTVAQSNKQIPISLYPIPCSTSFMIQTDNVEHVRIFDLLGTLRLEREYKGATSNPQLDISQLTPGVYTVEITSETRTNVVRMVKE